MTNVTEKESKALVKIISDAGNGATCAEEMKADNFTWFDHTVIMQAGFSPEAACGIMSSLQEKGLAQNYDPDGIFGWCLTDRGIDTAYKEKARGQ